MFGLNHILGYFVLTMLRKRSFCLAMRLFVVCHRNEYQLCFEFVQIAYTYFQIQGSYMNNTVKGGDQFAP